MRSLTPWRAPCGLRGSATSSQFLNAARWSSPQNFERALSCGPIGQRLGEALGLPVGGAPRQVLRDVEAERHRHLLILDGGEVEISRRRDPALRHLDAIVDRLHLARAENFARRELGRHDRGGEIRKHRRAVRLHAEQQVRHEHRHEPRQRLAEIDRHRLDVGIGRPQRIAGFHQRRAEMAAEHGLDLFRGRVDDRLLGLRALRIDHRLADDAEPHALQRARRRRSPWRGRRRACSAPTSAAPW